MALAPRFVIVRRGHFATFELLTRTFAGDPSVQIVWDRRTSDRRKAAVGPDNGERRRSDRRSPPPTEWGQLNYMIARENPGAAPA